MLLTRAPLYSPEQARDFSFDLHVLGTPPAFILSQDQTLQLKLCQPSHRGATVDFSESCLSELLAEFPSPCQDKETEVRWSSIQFSKSLFPCRAYYFRSAVPLCQASNGADEGAQPYATRARLSTPPLRKI